MVIYFCPDLYYTIIFYTNLFKSFNELNNTRAWLEATDSGQMPQLSMQKLEPFIIIKGACSKVTEHYSENIHGEFVDEIIIFKCFIIELNEIDGERILPAKRSYKLIFENVANINFPKRNDSIENLYMSSDHKRYWWSYFFKIKVSKILL